MRRLLLLLAFVLAALPAFAQFTTVSGTVTDPNGLPYALGTVTPVLQIPSGAGTPKFGQTPYVPPNQASGMDGTGSFVVTLADNNVLTPAGTRWAFIVCSSAGSVPPAFGKGPLCFTVNSVLITGASQSISATLTAAALPLTAPLTSQVLQNLTVTGTVNFPQCFNLNVAVGQLTTLCASAGGPFAINFPNQNGTITVAASTLALNAVNLGDGAHGIKTVAGFTTDGVSEMDLGANALGTGILGLVNTAGGGKATVRTGTGSPEGVVTATVGSLFSRQDGGAGTSLYVKQTGSGNTGWSAINPTAPAVQQSSTTTLSADQTLIANTPTTITGLTQSITMPSFGCPCRAFVAYGLNYSNTGVGADAGIEVSHVFDGTNEMATAQVLVTGAASQFGMNAAAFSPVTYANSAVVTFSIIVDASNAGGLVVKAANNQPSAQHSWFNIAIEGSN